MYFPPPPEYYERFPFVEILLLLVPCTNLRALLAITSILPVRRSHALSACFFRCCHLLNVTLQVVWEAQCDRSQLRPCSQISRECSGDSEPTVTEVGNVNERRTRRGVYAIVQEHDDPDENEGEDKETGKPLAGTRVVDINLESGDQSSKRPSISRRSISRLVLLKDCFLVLV